MTVNNSKVQISEAELFSVLFLSRFSSLLITRGISVFSFALELLLSAALSVLAYVAFKKANTQKMYFKITLAAFCVFLSALTLYSVYDFKSNAISLRISVVFIVLIFLGCTVYCAFLGVQSFSRFAPVCLAVIVLACVAVALGTLNDAEMKKLEGVEITNLFPLNFFKCIDIPIVFLLLAENTGKKQGRALASSILLSYFCTLLVYILCVAVVGQTEKIHEFPIFTLFQLGEIGSYNKLDILFTSPFLMAVFVKLSAYCYGILRVIK